jgi:hypothetical protein
VSRQKLPRQALKKYILSNVVSSHPLYGSVVDIVPFERNIPFSSPFVTLLKCFNPVAWAFRFLFHRMVSDFAPATMPPSRCKGQRVPPGQAPGGSSEKKPPSSSLAPFRCKGQRNASVFLCEQGDLPPQASDPLKRTEVLFKG